MQSNRHLLSVYDSELDGTDPTDEDVKESNDLLRQKVEQFNLPAVIAGESNSKAKGKKKAVRGRPRMEVERTNRADTQETDDSYHDEVRLSALTGRFLPILHDSILDADHVFSSSG